MIGKQFLLACSFLCSLKLLYTSARLKTKPNLSQLKPLECSGTYA